MSASTLSINRAPVLTLWAAVVAERLGHSRAEALTLGRAVAGMNAAAKAKRLGITEPAEGAAPAKRPPATPRTVELLGRTVPVVGTPKGPRAAKDGKPDSPEAVERYLASKFGAGLAPARAAFEALAGALPPKQLAARAYALYEEFRPEIPAGVTGWGARGLLDLDQVKRMTAVARRRG